MKRTGLIVIALVLCSGVGCKKKGKAEVNAAANTAPSITNMAAAPTRLDVGESTVLAVEASDADGDALAYQWSASCEGGFDADTSATPTFTLWARSDAWCVLEVRVEDAEGASATGAVTINLGPEVLPNILPIIDALNRSAAMVGGGETLIFDVAAHDPDGGALSFLWSASSGAFTRQSDSGGTSRVDWTAPACGTDLEPRIEVTVADAAGAATSQSFIVEMRCEMCFNGAFDGGETEIDCGGPNCAPCLACGGSCTITQRCNDETCVESSWSRVEGVIGTPLSIAVAPNTGATPFVLYVATDQGISASPDGATWTRGGPLDVLAVSSMPMPETAFASRSDGSVQQTRDGGVTWMATAGSPGAIIRGWIGISGVGPLGAGSRAGQAVVFRGQMSGANWTPSAPFGMGTATSIVFGGGTSPAAIAYVGVDGAGGGVFRSTNIGSPAFEFEQLAFSERSVLSLAIGSADRATIFAGTRGRGVHRSTDGGSSWSPVGLEGRTVRALAVDPADTARIYAGTEAGVYVSGDAAATWSLSGLESGSASSIALLNGATGTVYVATSLGLFVSRSGGR